MIKEQEPLKTRSDKAKEALKSSEDYLNEKLTIRSMLLMIIIPVLIKILEAVSLIVFVVPFQEQLTVYANLTFLVIFFFILLIGLYGFNEWKIRLELKSKTTAKTVKLSEQLKQYNASLTTTIEDKAKETMMSNAVVVTGIIQTQDEREEMKERNEQLQKIDYTPNGVDTMDIEKTRQIIRELEEQVNEQENKNLKDLEKDIAQDPEIDLIINAVKEVEQERSEELEKQLAELDQKAVPILEDESGNKYTENPDGSRDYL